MVATVPAMSRIRQVLGLYQNNRAIREIVRITGISRNSVRKYIREYGECEDITAIDDTALGSIVNPAETLPVPSKGSIKRFKMEYLLTF